MKNDIATNLAYRKVVAALSECEERYRGVVRSMDDTTDSRLASMVTTLKREIELRRGLEQDMRDFEPDLFFNFSGHLTTPLAIV
jgi:hypothetical protein